MSVDSSPAAAAPKLAAGAPKRARQRLLRRMRVRKRAEFLAIQERPRKASGQHYTVLTPAQSQPSPGTWRLGVTVSRKVGNAVVRNRVKRWLRESFRRQVPQLGPPRSLVVIARPSAAGSSYGETFAELARLIDRAAGRGR